MSQPKAANILWHQGHITKREREERLKQRGVIIWFTGLSGSGKSTVAAEVERRLFERGNLAYVLDGDNLRHGLNKDLGFSPEDRKENIRRVGEVAKLFADAGLIVLTAFISPYRTDRDQARALVGPGEFIEVYVKCSLEKCEERDVKGLYRRARAGEIGDFTGISAPYEEPVNPEIVLNTEAEDVETSVNRVLEYLEAKGIVK